MVILDLTVPGNPHPKERPRLGAGGSTRTPAKTKAAEGMIAFLARQKGVQTAETAVRLTVTFHRADRVRCDLDNLVKTVLDGLNKIAYTDDYLVEQLISSVTRGVGKTKAFTRIVVETI